ncbi:ribosomal protein S18-alanine N-acetyltransferase [Massilibacterium senegalense]|uniref:ribosomal protein S18-alanine N-acetyltransferase n=1 Tax=Massilibacterium senegalense TaxID=1632858 RepID=UPI000784C368|nr:ribosomal protein S18-alanine N-acetyltransferase [Massilibacterium senegalense]
MERINIRLMEEQDIPAILQVEHASFSIPWTEEAFFNELQKNKFAVYLVIEIEGKVIGYVGAWIIIDEAHITNIAILPDYRGKRLGEKLLAEMIKTAIQLGVKTMTLEVRISNEVAKQLYRKFGFKDGGIRKGYYTDNQEDALIMWVNFNEKG